MCRWKVMERVEVEVEVVGATLESLLAAATAGTRVRPHAGERGNAKLIGAHVILKMWPII